MFTFYFLCSMRNMLYRSTCNHFTISVKCWNIPVLFIPVLIFIIVRCCSPFWKKLREKNVTCVYNVCTCEFYCAYMTIIALFEHTTLQHHITTHVSTSQMIVSPVYSQTHHVTFNFNWLECLGVWEGGY